MGKNPNTSKRIAKQIYRCLTSPDTFLTTLNSSPFKIIKFFPTVKS